MLIDYLQSMCVCVCVCVCVCIKHRHCHHVYGAYNSAVEQDRQTAKHYQLMITSVDDNFKSFESILSILAVNLGTFPEGGERSLTIIESCDC